MRPVVALLHFSLMTSRADLPVPSPSWAPILCHALCAPCDGLLRDAFRDDISKYVLFQKSSVASTLTAWLFAAGQQPATTKERASNI